MSSNKIQKEEKPLKKIETSVKKKRRNYVMEDEIIREVAEKELLSQMKFEQQWNFMKAENLDKIYEELKQESCVNMEVLKLFSKYYKSKQPTHDPMNIQDLTVPKLSSGVIGWRSTNAENTLEIFGPLCVSSRRFSPQENELVYGNQVYSICLG